MITETHNEPWAHRLGRGAGRVWRWAARRDQQLTRTLMAHGVPARFASTMLWLVKLVVLGVLFYAAFWLALLVVFAIVAAWAARNTDWDHDHDDKAEWRSGWDGFGLYRGEVRIDGGSADDE
ncbi:DUF3742 family protein [Paraburkholderia aspalathi]|uniref:DUF3742 family protein n=1 Tax=Paraburkholderia aspalathi TaxID=1324617 RepID=A0A1I7ABZ4_9BURK|nr:DUF3742 family protein [Paraburkholderia aspalathi]SFT72476.1 Protein of unknown function [Paraburkholderia aspalathi]